MPLIRAWACVHVSCLQLRAIQCNAGVMPWKRENYEKSSFAFFFSFFLLFIWKFHSTMGQKVFVVHFSSSFDTNKKFCAIFFSFTRRQWKNYPTMLLNNGKLFSSFFFLLKLQNSIKVSLRYPKKIEWKINFPCWKIAPAGNFRFIVPRIFIKIEISICWLQIFRWLRNSPIMSFFAWNIPFWDFFFTEMELFNMLKESVVGKSLCRCQMEKKLRRKVKICRKALSFEDGRRSGNK